MTSFDRNIEELREIRRQLSNQVIEADGELDRLANRLIFLREQIDLSRKEVEGARKLAQQELQVIQDQLDRERLP